MMRHQRSRSRRRRRRRRCHQRRRLRHYTSLEALPEALLHAHRCCMHFVSSFVQRERLFVTAIYAPGVVLIEQ